MGLNTEEAGKSTSGGGGKRPRRASILKPILGENAGLILLAGGFVAYSMNYRTLGMIAMGLGTVGVLDANLML